MKGYHYALLFLLTAISAFGQDVPNDKRIEGRYQAGSTHSDKAVATIVASNDIQQQASVEYVAGKSITLLPGFKTDRSVLFSATIQSVSLLAASHNSEQESSNMVLYPNPVEDVVLISYSLRSRTAVELVITDERGNTVAKIIDGEIQDEGLYKKEWRGNLLKTGLYICTLQAGTVVSSVKLIKK